MLYLLDPGHSSKLRARNPVQAYAFAVGDNHRDKGARPVPREGSRIVVSTEDGVEVDRSARSINNPVEVRPDRIVLHCRLCIAPRVESRTKAPFGHPFRAQAGAMAATRGKMCRGRATARPCRVSFFSWRKALIESES